MSLYSIASYYTSQNVLWNWKLFVIGATGPLLTFRIMQSLKLFVFLCFHLKKKDLVQKQMDVALKEILLLTAVDNPCGTQNGGCDHLCVLSHVSDNSGVGYTCKCDPGFSLSFATKKCNRKWHLQERWPTKRFFYNHPILFYLILAYAVRICSYTLVLLHSLTRPKLGIAYLRAFNESFDNFIACSFLQRSRNSCWPPLTTRLGASLAILVTEMMLYYRSSREAAPF